MMGKDYSLVLREKGLDTEKNRRGSSKALHARKIYSRTNFPEEPEIFEIAPVEQTDLVVRIGPNRINHGGLNSQAVREGIVFS